MLVSAAGTGVTTYARQLHRAHAKISSDRVLLSDRPDLDQLPQTPFGRAARWLRALAPVTRQTVELTSPKCDNLLVASDVFRIAQVYFDVHRRPLRVRLPGRRGIMHWTYPVPLTVVGWHNLYTVHDVIPLVHPELTHIEAGRYRRLLNRLAECATGFITVSEIARAEIIQTIRCPTDFVVNCSLAVESRPAAADLLPGMAPRSFLLACGTIEKRKNLGRLLEAYRQSGITMPLLIAGPDGRGGSDIAGLVDATPGAIRLPYLDRIVLHALITHARALVMPSLAEGFGLPVAEAMALGTPVVTSNRGALADTAGGAALTVDPLDVEGLATALRRLASDDALCAMLAEAGRRNAVRFSPARFAERLTRVYTDVMAKPR